MGRDSTTWILVLVGVAAVVFYFKPDILAGITSRLTDWVKSLFPAPAANDATYGSTTPSGESSVSKPIPPEYTTIPVVPSEPDVSQGEVPAGFKSVIPLCPSLTPMPRYSGDDQVCCQCPTGQIQCGKPASMHELMQGTSTASAAWRHTFCGL